MELKYVFAGLLVLFIILFLRGSSIATECGQIATCSACWQNIPITVSGSQCSSNSSCFADPADQEYNAWVDVLLCSCDAAKSASYTDAPLNQKISETVKTTLGYDITAQQLCEQPGLLLTKHLYG